MKYIERKDLETDHSLKYGHQQSNAKASVASFNMLSQEKSLQALKMEDAIDEEDELLCLENADDLVIDSTFKSPETKPRNDIPGKDYQNFGIQLNGLDSANINTQIGAENLENKQVSEISKFESDKLAEARTIVGQKQVELNPSQVLNNSS